MIVAGLGSRRGVPASKVHAAIRAAADAYGLPVARIGRLATGDLKAGDRAFAEVAREMGVALEIVPAGVMAAQATATQSPASLDHTGTGSFAEAAALASAGEGARLLGPRVVSGAVTCALAESAP
jgi:cobalt-precorrin 5A hydrolase